MVTVAELLGGRRTIPVEIGPSTVQVTYDPNVLTLAYRRALRDRPTEVFIAETVLEWDIDDVDPSDAEQVAGLHPEITNPIVWAVLNDRPLSNATPASTANGSRRRGATAKRSK